MIHYQLTTFESQLSGELQAQADALGMSLYEVVTLASIVADGHRAAAKEGAA